MKKFHITVNGTPYDVQVEEIGASAASVSAPVAPPAPVAAPAAPAVPAAPAPAEAPKAAAAPVEGSETINAPMPGTVMSVPKGQVLLILEAMKMENEIMSPRDAVVAGVHVNKGDSVDSGKLLISLQ